ncbi:hypothetical protein LX32DRAFT_81774 [Colletotrichum zoysiae]|uniref:Uncharacterized protein n=1 Tax=Colletotrichum zoysiae TaxID=1216348 RepID=A0AAD9M0E2_9PEZI|nr:hypothetical protein LX32DRAFT_81774 [Colletotrichum zoysiae]
MGGVGRKWAAGPRLWLFLSLLLLLSSRLTSAHLTSPTSRQASKQASHRSSAPALHSSRYGGTWCHSCNCAAVFLPLCCCCHPTYRGIG